MAGAILAPQRPIGVIIWPIWYGRSYHMGHRSLVMEWNALPDGQWG